MVSSLQGGGVMRTIIAFTGLAGSGKTTAAKYLCTRHGFERVRFAGPLKDMMRALGLSEREIEGDLKEKPCDLLCGRTPRHGMQTLGSEWRDLIDRDLWTRIWRRRVEALAPAVPVVVDDCRFPHEVDAIRELGGLLVKVERPGLTAGSHVSEVQELGPIVATIRNTGTVAAFLDRVDREMRDLSWVGHTH